MLMASYRLIKKAKAVGYEKLVHKLIDEEELINVIDIRAKYQRTGFSILKQRCISKILIEY